MGGPYNVPATSFVQSLVDGNQRYAGFMVQNISVNQTEFDSSRASDPSAWPVLTVSCTVPEPSALVLLGIGAIGVLGHAWRRRSRFHR